MGNNQAVQYSVEPQDKAAFTKKFDHFYTKIAGLYAFCVPLLLPFWKCWLNRAVPHICGPRVLEVSFGTGYLLTQYADKFEEIHGIDLNERLVSIATNELVAKGLQAELIRGNVEDMPYEDEYFDCVVNTMAFSGYPDGHKAMSEMKRVLKRGGRLVMIDPNYPRNHNFIGMHITKMWAACGDIIRDMVALLDESGFECIDDEEIGGFGSVHLYLATKK